MNTLVSTIKGKQTVFYVLLHVCVLRVFKKEKLLYSFLGELMMSLLWYYRPEHTQGGRNSSMHQVSIWP